MKYSIILLIILFNFSVISAEDCFGMSADCPDGFNVNCWEDDTSYNWNCVSDGSGSLYSITPDGNNWCNADEVIDYNKLDCCPENFPYLEYNTCHTDPSTDTPAKNFFTERFICNPREFKCENKEQFVCINSLNDKSDDIIIRETYEWVGTGKRIGECGYEECYGSETKCIGANEYICENNKWAEQDIIVGKCGVECGSGQKETIYNEDGSWTYLIKNFCNEPIEVTKFCNDGNVERQYLIETCEEYQCVPDQKIEIERIIGECDIECFKDSDCADNRTTGKYWSDKQLFYDIVEQKCENELCNDIRFPVNLDTVFESTAIDVDDVGKSKIKLIWEYVVDWIRTML